MNRSNNTHRHHHTDETKGLRATLNNLQPAAVVLMLLAVGVLAYMLWLFFGGYQQIY